MVRSTGKRHYLVPAPNLVCRTTSAVFYDFAGRFGGTAPLVWGCWGANFRVRPGVGERGGKNQETDFGPAEPEGGCDGTRSESRSRPTAAASELVRRGRSAGTDGPRGGRRAPAASRVKSDRNTKDGSRFSSLGGKPRAEEKHGHRRATQRGTTPPPPRGRERPVTADKWKTRRRGPRQGSGSEKRSDATVGTTCDMSARSFAQRNLGCLPSSRRRGDVGGPVIKGKFRLFFYF